jgi:hypothetical protein
MKKAANTWLLFAGVELNQAKKNPPLSSLAERGGFSQLGS